MTPTRAPRRAAIAVTLGLASIGAVTAQTTAQAATTVNCLGKKATIVATGSHRVVRGTDKADVIVALGFADKVYGQGGNDTICVGDAAYVGGGNGADRISFWGSAIVHGNNGDDEITGVGGHGIASPQIYGDAGDDIIKLVDGGTAYGGSGNDTLVGALHYSSFVRGGDGSDSLTARAPGTTLDGGNGADSFHVPASIASSTTLVDEPGDKVNGNTLR